MPVQLGWAETEAQAADNGMDMIFPICQCQEESADTGGMAEAQDKMSHIQMVLERTFTGCILREELQSAA